MPQQLGRRKIESDDNQGYDPYSGGGQQQRNYAKRQRPSDRPSRVASPAEQLEAMMIRFGAQDPHIILANIETFAIKLPHGDDAALNKDLKRILVDCATYLPSRHTIYSTLVGLLNVHNHRLGASVVDTLMASLRQMLIDGQYDYALNIILFVADLMNSNVVSSHSLYAFLNTFVIAAKQADVPQCRSDWFVYVVLHSLVYCGHKLNAENAMHIETLLGECQTYIDGRSLVHVPMLKVWLGDEGGVLPQEDFLVSLWQQTLTFKEEKFQDYVLQRYYSARSLSAAFNDALQHNLPIFVPPSHHADAVYPLPTVVFRLFSVDDVGEQIATATQSVMGAAAPEKPVDKNKKPLPSTDSIERFLIEQDVRWLLVEWHTSRKDTVKALLNYALLDVVPFMHIVVEVMFGELLRLPSASIGHLGYASVLVELEKHAEYGRTVSTVLSCAADRFFCRMMTMQPVAIDRVSEWLSFHLSHHNYQYGWTDWECALDTPEMHPQRYYVIECLQRIMRLSYHGRIGQLVPSSFSALFPKPPVIHFKYVEAGGEELPGADSARELEELLTARADVDKVIQFMTDFPQHSTMSQVNHLAIDVFTSVLLNLSSRTLEFTVTGLTKYARVFKQLVVGGDEDAQLTLLQTVFELWHDNQQRLMFVIDKFIKMTVLDCEVVVRWIFSPKLAEQTNRQWTWILLENVMSKLRRQVRLYEREVVSVRAITTETKNSMDLLEETVDSNADAKNEGVEEGDEEAMQVDGPASATSRLQRVTNAYNDAASNLEKLESNITATNQAHNNLIMTLFQNFVIALTEHMMRCETEGEQFDTPWFRWMVGRMRHMFLFLNVDAAKQIGELEEFLFTSEVDVHILEVFHQFKALRA